ncbi:olfactomedin-4-like [Gouania willdenowi]|uniref:Olfactomedin-4-like n=1 Tax=Gouania willdenowi TaxID=441366 RepID=A0A8C5EFN3_GOUWI|nr:olfactomedin-4-like [Gouania willdenowi]XP_028305741.1 olfactomedin-4-like [Gouania willdenowi]XP_028305742.1 olfactomedin-4-like [Gouania willdenowi]
MKLLVCVSLWTLFTFTQQVPPVPNKCTCELSNSGQMFPHDQLSKVLDDVSMCNKNITPQTTLEMEILLLALQRRLPQLEDDVLTLEKEDDGELYGAVSLYLIENEVVEIMRLMNKLNSTTLGHQGLTTNATQQLEDLVIEMKELEQFDTMHVVKMEATNQRLTKSLENCKHEKLIMTQPTQPPPSSCPHGKFLNITGPRIHAAGEYPGSYKYGSWGRDPKAERGKESWYWRVMLTVNNKDSNYVRLYSTLSSLIVGLSVPGNILIHSSNPTTNTIQGPNVVMYGGSLYYNCYNTPSVCQFNLINKTISTLQLPVGTRYNSRANFCHLAECYPYTDLDLATDESGVWVIYTTTQDFGNVLLSKVSEGEPLVLSQTWRTSLYKMAVTNTFMACGVLYATRFVNQDVEEIFYSFDTITEEERFDVGIFMKKMSPNIQFLNYSPVDQMLHVYSDSLLVSYKVLFEANDDS